MREAAQYTFSIFGTCVSRDILAIVGANVNRFVQDINPISAVLGSPLEDNQILTEKTIRKYLSNPESSHFHVRNIILDVNKSAYAYLFEAKSDWLILDMGCLRLHCLMDKNRKTGITAFNYERARCFDAKSFKAVYPMDLSDDEFNGWMEKYALPVLKNYSEERIVVIGIRCVSQGVDRDRQELCYLGDFANINEEIGRGEAYLKKRWKGGRFIPFLDNVIGDERHQWGLGPLHFVSEYYEYGAEAMSLIMQQLPVSEERYRMKELQEKYQGMINERYSHLRTSGQAE